jgi:hypothetical protein
MTKAYQTDSGKSAEIGPDAVGGLDTVIGLDIGGTKIVAGLINFAGEILTSHTVPTPRTGAMDILNAAVDVCKRAMAEAKTPPLAIGAGSAGQVDSSTGRITFASNLYGWTGFPLGEQLHAVFNMPVLADNDVNAMARRRDRRGKCSLRCCWDGYWRSARISGGVMARGASQRGRDRLSGGRLE